MELTKEQKKERMKSVSRHINIAKANLLDMYQLLDVMDNDTRMEVEKYIEFIKTVHPLVHEGAMVYAKIKKEKDVSKVS